MLKIDENLSIELLTGCNSNCKHCFAKASLKKNSSLDVNVVMNIIEESFNLGYRSLHFTGGEPLLYKDFFKIIDYSLDKGFNSIFFNTNGTLLTDETAKLISKYDDKISFSISLQGYQGLHDSIRGNGSYEAAVRGIKSAINAGLNLSIFTSVGKSLLPVLASYIDFVFNDFNGIHDLTLIQMIRVTDDFYDLSKEVLEPQDFISMVKIVSSLNLYGYEIHILENPLVKVVSDLLKMPWIHNSKPLHREGRVFLFADGKLGLTHSSRLFFNEYSKGMLSGIINSEEYRETVEPDKKICPYCEFYEICKRNGMIRPSEWYRDMNQNIPYCQRVIGQITRR